MLDVRDRYRHDGTFRRVVDQLRSLLSAYHVTPSELREAVILAATMHEDENIRPIWPILIDANKIDRNALMYNMQDYNPPAMFGGLNLKVDGCISGRWDSSKQNFGNFTEQAKPVECGCTKELGKDAPKPAEHVHFFHGQNKRDYNVCDCGISNTYYFGVINKAKDKS